MHFDGGNVILTLLLGEAVALLPQLVARADAFFLDGFAPAKNPASGRPRWCASSRASPARAHARHLDRRRRRALGARGAGFRVDKRAGFGAKREMLAGVRRAQPRGGAARAPGARGRRGLAGTLAAERLAARGLGRGRWSTRARAQRPGRGLLRPIVNLRDAVNAQASRSAFLYALQHYRALQHDGYHLQWDRCGVLQLAADEEESVALRGDRAGRRAFPAAFPPVRRS
jgi:tRNA 5-methylaminomethyl-2-thiouridine biosynthesis bifunctional protein